MSGIARGNHNVILKASAALTASTTGPEIVIADGYTRIHVVLSITAVAATTTPTLDVYVQNAIRFPAAADLVGNQCTGVITWNDLIHFNQATATGVQYASFIETAGFMDAAEDAALAVQTVRAGIIGNRLRVKSVLAGTSVSFTFSVFAELLP